MAKQQEENVHASQLSTFYKCPFKYKFDDSNIPVAITYIWDVVHLWAMWYETERLQPLVEYYVDYINGDYKTKNMMYDLIKLAQKWYMNNKFYVLWQETKLAAKFWDVYLTSTPDVVLKNWDYVKVIDFKTGSKNWYGWQDVRDSEMQPDVYSWLVMEYLWVTNIDFSFHLFDKTKRQEFEFTRNFEKTTVENKLKNVITEYKQSKDNDSWQPKKNRLCNMCPLKENGCPLFKVQEVIEEENDILDF